MREIEELQKAWLEGAHFRRLFSDLSFDEDGLVFGAGTILARRNADGDIDISGEEARFLTLLSVAYERPIDVSVLGAVRRASRHARAGNLPKAAMHIALAGLPRLTHPPDAARRIFIADGLLAKGVRPRDIFAALELNPIALDQLEKFDPDEPRIPKGSGRPSGQWTRENSSVSAGSLATLAADAEEALPQIAEAVAGAVARAVPIIAAAASDVSAAIAAPVFAAATLLIPTPEKSSIVEGPIENHPSLRYVWNEDETELRIVQVSDGRVVLRATLTADGKLVVGPRLIGRKKGDKVEIDPFALPPDWPGSVDDQTRRLCPKESPDRPGRSGTRGETDRNFEDQMKRWVNPGNPTPRGMGYSFFNPLTGNNIIFDDCQQRTGWLFDAKGAGYLALLTNKNRFVADGVRAKLIAQAKNQIAASEGREIYWCFAEEKAAELAADLFYRNSDKSLRRIHFCHLPPED